MILVILNQSLVMPDYKSSCLLYIIDGGNHTYCFGVASYSEPGTVLCSWLLKQDCTGLTGEILICPAKAPICDVEHYLFQYSYISDAYEASGSSIAVDTILTKGVFSHADSQLLSEKLACVQWLGSHDRAFILSLMLNENEKRESEIKKSGVFLKKENKQKTMKLSPVFAGRKNKRITRTVREAETIRTRTKVIYFSLLTDEEDCRHGPETQMVIGMKNMRCCPSLKSKALEEAVVIYCINHCAEGEKSQDSFD
ncbi:hypothetical protein WISP_149184 [Willisornis vidua]|uniref:Uncharacterized protein n=1 Tax=Willisornis vidua TaxID=1566151 RepID=A0ABQ9CQ28_9PASS|nr:hypothetical protein WISP_149184 [Willisornis vidua]